MFGTIINSEGFSESTSEKDAPDQVELSEEDIQEQEEREEQERKEQEEAVQEQKEEQEEKERQEQEEQERKEKEAAEANPNKSNETQVPTEPVSVPSGQESVVINDNIPLFSNADISSTDVYHRNGALDSLGRVTAANAIVGVEIMPAEERGDIGHHEPTGWNQERYEGIGAGGWLYNRSHLIGHQMTGNDDYANLMTGTRWFNMRMLEYENYVANYVEITENHVRYRVTPIFEGNNLVASGAYMEGFSIEDNGEGLMFNIYVPNIQPGIEINYADGSSVALNEPNTEDAVAQKPEPDPKPEPKPTPEPEPKPEPDPEPEPEDGDVSSVDTNGNGTVTISEAEAAGYSMPITDDHWLYKYMIDRDGDGMVGE
ncbi:DNA/RNA non-specific endonuclease [Streptohalobacillus salinus]|nr:DNA/RNA non-specific endonuclease [Streptohalobacillus salinus]